MECSVHIYKYSQQKRRDQLKSLTKAGVLEYIGRSGTHKYYKILNIEEYKKRK